MMDLGLEGIGLTGIHLALTIGGGLLAVYVMQLTRHEAEDTADPWLVREFGRISLMLIALALLWSAYYSLSHQWSPWPPELLLIFAIDLALAMRTAAIWASVRRSGRGSGRIEDKPQGKIGR